MFLSWGEEKVLETFRDMPPMATTEDRSVATGYPPSEVARARLRLQRQGFVHGDVISRKGEEYLAGVGSSEQEAILSRRGAEEERGREKVPLMSEGEIGGIVDRVMAGHGSADVVSCLVCGARVSTDVIETSGCPTCGYKLPSLN